MHNCILFLNSIHVCSQFALFASCSCLLEFLTRYSPKPPSFCIQWMHGQARRFLGEGKLKKSRVQSFRLHPSIGWRAYFLVLCTDYIHKVSSALEFITSLFDGKFFVLLLFSGKLPLRRALIFAGSESSAKMEHDKILDVCSAVPTPQ